MPKQEKPSEQASIIQIIQDMVKEGESEEKIVKTLSELGVEPQKAKRLLLLGQADTFALLRNEISKIAKSDVEKEIPSLAKLIVSESKKNTMQMQEALEKSIEQKYLPQIEQYKQQLASQKKIFDEARKSFEAALNSDRQGFQGTVERTQAEIEKRAAKYEEKLDKSQASFEKLIQEFEQSQRQKQQKYQELLNKIEERANTALSSFGQEIEAREKKFEELTVLSDKQAREKIEKFGEQLLEKQTLAKKDFSDFEKTINTAEKRLAKDFGEKVTTSIELSEKVRDRMNELGEQIYQAQVDLEEIKAKGIGARNKIISLALILLGIGFCASALYLFYTAFQTQITIDSIIVTVVVSMIGVTMLFVSTIV